MELLVDDTKVTERGTGLWSVSGPFSLLGARFGRRMVIVSRNGVSALLSPNRLSRRILDESFGREFKVDFLIAPTAYHDTFFSDAAKEFPDAKCTAAASDALLTIENRTARARLDQDGDEREQRQRQDTAQQYKAQIHHAFDRLSPWKQEIASDLDSHASSRVTGVGPQAG